MDMDEALTRLSEHVSTVLKGVALRSDVRFGELTLTIVRDDIVSALTT